MSKFANPARRQDAPPPGDPTARPQQQVYELQPQAPDPPPKTDATRPDDPSRQRAPPESTLEDRDRDRDRDREQTRQRPPVTEDRGKQRAEPAEPIPQDRERTKQRPPGPTEDRGKQRAPQELLAEERDRDRNNTRQRPSSSDDRGKARAPAELLQSSQGPQAQYTERSPLFTPRSNTPHTLYAAAAPAPAPAGPSRGYDRRQHSPTGSGDIVLTDNRTQLPSQQQQQQPKTGFWTRIMGGMKDRDRDEEVEHVRGRLPPQPVLPNILLFGSHGSGKSSLINMLAGKEASRTSDKGFAAFSTSGYALEAGGINVAVWDVVGMRRGHGDEISEDAARNLRRLIQNLHGGVNLLMHCVNATHPGEDWKLNYEAFYRVLGSKKVPIVLVVTGLEDHVPMEEWWKINGAGLKKWGMTFDGHACITTIRGKPLNNFPGHWYDEQYEQSRLAVRELIKAKLAPAVIIREEGKLAELRELLREENAKAASQNGDKDKGKNTRGERTTGSRDVNDGHRSTQDNQGDDDMTDRIEREGRTASLALLGGLLAVFIVLQSGIMSCI